jgi:hypothetical protein
MDIARFLPDRVGFYSSAFDSIAFPAFTGKHGASHR